MEPEISGKAKAVLSSDATDSVLEAKKHSGVHGLQKRGADSVLGLEGFVPAVVFSGRELSEAPHSCAKSKCV